MIVGKPALLTSPSAGDNRVGNAGLPLERMGMIPYLIMQEYDRGETNYHEYIQSKEWKALANEMKRKAGFRCRVCGMSGFAISLHLHHNNYSRVGNEKEQDLLVACADCHGFIHGKRDKPGSKFILTDQQLSLALKNQGVTYTNDDPYKMYALGKMIIQHIINDWDPALFDRYNKVNIYILDTALDNEHQRRLEKMQEEGWGSYGDEFTYRAEVGYWKGWDA